MAEIVGLTASVFTLAGAAATVSLKVYDFIDTIRHAKEELETLALETSGLSTVLDHLGAVLEESKDFVTSSTIETTKILTSRCTMKVKELEVTVDLIQAKATGTRWLLRKRKTLEMKLSLEGFKSTLSLIIQTITLGKILKMNDNSAQNPKKVEEVQRNINVLSSAVLSNRQLVEKLHLAEAVLNEDLDDGQESVYGGSSSEGDDERRARRAFQADYTAAMSPPPYNQASQPPERSTQLMRTYDGVQPIGSPSADIYASLPSAVVQSRTGNTPRPAAPTSGPFGQPPPLIDLSIPTSEDGSYSRTAKQEVRALLGEWTSTPSSVMSQYLGKVPMMKEQPSRPEASSNTTQQGRSNQTQPANRSTEDTSLAKPYATIEAWSSHKAEQQSLIACLADRGGGYVWRHEDEANHWYYVGERLVVQYRLYKSDADKASSNLQALKTVISKQWIYKDTLTKSGYHFAEYGEGNYAIAGLLTPQTVHVLHTSASRWKEELMEKRAKQALPKPERQMVKARYSFRAPKPTDLPFEIADIFDADVDKSQQWWKAYKNGTSGDIPANYVEVVVDVRETERQLVQATRNHESSSSTHLNFTRDDIFEADTFRETEWWRGHIQDGSGLFQAKYVEVIGPA